MTTLKKLVKLDRPILLNIAGENFMLKWSIIFLVIAGIAGLLGFTGIAGTAIGIAKVLFFIFLILFVITLIAGGLLVKKVKDTLTK